MSEFDYGTSLKQMNQNIHVLYSDRRSNIGIIHGSENILVVDSGQNENHTTTLCQNVDQNKLKYAVLTHYHMDHTLGLEYLNCISFGHFNIKKNLLEYRKRDYSDEGLKNQIEKKLIPAIMLNWYNREYPDRSKVFFKNPTITYKKYMEIDLGNQIVQLKHIDCDHTDDTTIVYVPNEEALFLGDCLSPNSGNFINIEVIRKILYDFLSYESKILVEGHGPPLGNGVGNNYLTDLITITDMAEQYGKDISQKEDLILSKMKIFTHPDVSSYIPLFINGLQ
jgi:glyoxylase-like metal-dependent hydrolase (beta-lactamase superfamily II)